MVTPFFWKVVAIALGKKATVYLLGRWYGYPRVYRRLLEYSRRSLRDRTRQRVMQNRVKAFFRFPNAVYYWFRQVLCRVYITGMQVHVSRKETTPCPPFCCVQLAA